jgi:hypothetical protein
MLGSGRIRGRGSGSKEESIPVLQVRFLDRYHIQKRFRSLAIASLCFVFCSNPGENCLCPRRRRARRGTRAAGRSVILAWNTTSMASTCNSSGGMVPDAPSRIAICSWTTRHWAHAGLPQQHHHTLPFKGGTSLAARHTPVMHTHHGRGCSVLPFSVTACTPIYHCAFARRHSTGESHQIPKNACSHA